MAGTSEGEEDIMAEVTGQGTAGTQGTTGATGTSVSGAGSVPAGQPLKFGGKEYGSVEDLGKAYESAQSELGKWTQQHGDLQKKYDEAQTQAQRWNEWWQTVQPLWGDDVESVLRAKLTGQGRQPAQQVQQQVSNKKLETAPTQAGGAPVYKLPTSGGKSGFGSLRQQAANALAQKFGPSIFNE